MVAESGMASFAIEVEVDEDVVVVSPLSLVSVVWFFSSLQADKKKAVQRIMVIRFIKNILLNVTKMHK